MFATLAKKVVGTRNDRILKRLRRHVGDVRNHGEQLASSSDEELRARTDALRERVGAGESLEDLDKGTYDRLEDLGYV